MTAWHGEHETNKCWAKINNILMGESVVEYTVESIFLSIGSVGGWSNACGRHISTQRSCHASDR